MSVKMRSTSIDDKSLQEWKGVELAMRTEGTTGVADRSLGGDGDAIATVLLEGVGGGREG